MFPPSSSFNSLVTWSGGAFLIGIAWHSLFPYQPTSVLFLSLLVIAGCACLLFAHKRVTIKIAGLLLIFFMLGVWRFDVVRPMLPGGLQPLQPKGLASSFRAPNLSTSISWLETNRQHLTGRINQLFQPDEAALLSGILYGARTMTPVLNARFRIAGLLPLVAVSGSNVTILVTLILPILLALRLARRQAFLILSCILILFVLFVHPSASVVRAAIMGWLVEFAPLVGRIPRPSRLLLLSAIAFTAWQPWALLYDPSFALSFLAMWGLLTWSGWFNTRLKSSIPWDGVRTIMSATLGATLMTIPYTAWAFGQLSLFGLITNLLALPLVPWSMALGTLAILAPLPIFVVPARGFLDLILLIARLPEMIPVGFWKNLQFSAWGMLAVYFLLLWWWKKIQTSSLFYPQENKNPSEIR